MKNIIEENGVTIVIERDEFASECFSIPIYNISINVDGSHFTNVREIVNTITRLLVDLNNNMYLICKHNLSDIYVLQALEGVGFKLTSIDITFYAKPSDVRITAFEEFQTSRIGITIEKFEKNKHNRAFSELFEHVTQFFNNTHFYNSLYLNKEACDLFYKKWILNDINGRSNRNYIAIQNNRIVGFLFCIEKNNECIIDLIWVDKKMRGKNIGKYLIYRLFSDVDSKIIRVGTQLTNINAINLYLKLGFKIDKVYAVYHKYGGVIK